MLTVDILAQEIRRVDGNHSLGAGALAEALMPFLTAALAVQTQQGVEGLGWHKPDQRNSLSRAENNLGVYRVWTHFEANGRWFWSLDGYEKVSGECASEEEAKAAAQSDYEQRIRSALVDVPAVESEPVAWQTMDSAPKDGTEIIAAERWERTGKVRVRVYKYEGHPNYWHCREDGVCIRPEYQSRYVWTPVPAALSTRKGSAGDGSATGTSGGEK